MTNNPSGGCGCKVVFKVGYGIGTIEYCPTHAASFQMLEALKSVAAWFERMKNDQYEKLVHNQTFESASANWDKLLQEPLEMKPILEVIKAAEGKTL